jgi:hypothetical protein
MSQADAQADDSQQGLGDRIHVHVAALGGLELLRESPRVLLQVLSDARRAADLIGAEDPDASPDGGAMPTR